MPLRSLPFLLAAFAALCQAAVPQFSAAGVVNAASYAGGAIAPGEIVTIFGAGLGPSEPALMRLTPDGRQVTTSLAGTRVLFDGVAAPLIYVAASQVSAVVPFAVAARTATQVQVEYVETASAPVTVPVARARPGVFTLDATGRGKGAILNSVDQKANGPGNAAVRGSAVMVYAAAGGWTSPPAADGRIADEALLLPLPVSATVGDVPATVLYAGAAPTLVTGVLQVNVQIPESAPTGDAVPLAISIDGVRSQPGVTLAVRPAASAGRVVLTSPYIPRPNVYKGQLHAHSTNSDGAQDPATVVQAYKDAGYDFISLTDHNRVTPDPGVSGILFIPGIEQAPGGNHLNRINVNDVLSGGEQSMIDRTLAQGGFVILNHPNWPGGYPANPNWTDAELEAVRGYHGIEVWNALVAPNNNAENRIDYLLSRQHRFFLFATDDCHDVNNRACKTASTRVFAERLEADQLIENLRSGNFYASNGAAITSVSTSERTVLVTTDRLSTIDFIAAGGRLVQTTGQTFSAAYTVVGDETYVRARVTRDADRRTAWTNPIYVDQ